MIVTTMNDIPGYEVDEVFGEVMGLTVRSRNIGSQPAEGGRFSGRTSAASPPTFAAQSSAPASSRSSAAS